MPSNGFGCIGCLTLGSVIRKGDQATLLEAGQQAQVGLMSLLCYSLVEHRGRGSWGVGLAWYFRLPAEAGN